MITLEDYESPFGTIQQICVGSTIDLERRLTQHNAGADAKTTRGRKWILSTPNDIRRGARP